MCRCSHSSQRIRSPFDHSERLPVQARHYRITGGMFPATCYDNDAHGTEGSVLTASEIARGGVRAYARAREELFL
ncbi:hypothetical protein GCM10010307_38560 [Streptomyces vastus]|uniref:Uncharacterized protein n=1 Tax=Streptomyces vastus TaxID=285451 RepID=A0ABN3QZQ6_9ACTN